MTILDTSGLLAWLDSSQRHHRATRRSMEKLVGPYFLSPFVMAEMDYLLSTRVGRAAQRAFLREVARGAYQLEPFDAADVAQTLEIIERYSDHDISLADASLLVIAQRRRCTRILTLDERHFRVLVAPGDVSFTLLPSDA